MVQMNSLRYLPHHRIVHLTLQLRLNSDSGEQSVLVLSPHCLVGFETKTVLLDQCVARLSSFDTDVEFLLYVDVNS